MSDTLGLLEEATQVVRDLGYRVREEPLGDLPGGACLLGGHRHVILNAQLPATQRLELLIDLLATDPAALDEPMSRLLADHVSSRRRGSGA